LAVEIGGPKRLYAMISVLSGIFLTPLAVLALALSSVRIFIVNYLPNNYFLVFHLFFPRISTPFVYGRRICDDCGFLCRTHLLSSEFFLANYCIILPFPHSVSM
jgi:hypothetical protein